MTTGGPCVIRPLLLILLLLPALAQAAGDLVRDEPIRPLSAVTGLDPARVELGRLLFHDPRLSGDGSVSCASCHDLAGAGTDRRRVSIGIGGQEGEINAPTVFNAALNLAQFWDGRADTLEQQVDGPLGNPVEMGADWDRIVTRLRADPEMRQRFRQIYPDGVTPANIRDAIATFERNLITTDAPFDRWLRGDDQALTPVQLSGYRLFKEYGCISCHQGVNVGGNMYGHMGAMGDYFTARGGEITRADLGRFNVTGREEDKFLFKVPSLRLALLTPPYFHDGSATTIQEAIRTMAKFQLGRQIPDRDVEAIIAFLGSLAGHHPLLEKR